MHSIDVVLDRLSTLRVCGYHARSAARAEPTALAALALIAHQRSSAAVPHVERLLELQNPDGSVGIDHRNPVPGWPTGWAILAWRAAQSSPIFAPQYVDAAWRAQQWVLGTSGDASLPESWEGHDTRKLGWPWVQGTHSWIEPTAINLLALKHTGRASHHRARDAAAMLIDRLLESGGCNYGNTVVFGQALRPHVQPTGLSLLALRGETDPSGRLIRSVDYLHRELSAQTPTASLTFGLLGLAAQQAYVPQAFEWLNTAAHRVLGRDPAGYPLALLALAALGAECPLVRGIGTPTVLTSDPQPATP